MENAQWTLRSIETVFAPEKIPPHSVPEIVFAGRSNVGKSSLINRLVGRKVAYVGATPGKTRSINFFTIDATVPFSLVDLPGYGYAVAGKSERSKWAHLVRTYFVSRIRVPLVLHLVDFRHGFLDRDIELTDGSLGCRSPKWWFLRRPTRYREARGKELSRNTSDSFLSPNRIAS